MEFDRKTKNKKQNQNNKRLNYGKLHFECLNEADPVQEDSYDLLQRN